jgi:hypothetical protein
MDAVHAASDPWKYQKKKSYIIIISVIIII